ncbi:transposase [Sinorhizobium sp. CCBAU 05631]|uniref:transposase n=1 Tax=Sinorhizobium sp. CCBAU 05631 TaxID=794846 RepID=UPI001FCCA1AF|nr:transposase [Sinorhizobium sp. CCBAU 05631]
MLGDLYADLLRLEERIRQATKEIEAIADREDVARRLMTIPGIGALGATALLAAIGNGLQFRKARHLTAWCNGKLDGVTGRTQPARFGGLVVVPHNDGVAESGMACST